MPMSKNEKQLNQAIKNYLCSAQSIEASSQEHLFGRGAVAELEQKIAGFYGMRHALCTVNATTGLLGLALALDLKNSEFITSPYTFGGTVASWLMLNNSIVFADVESQWANINPKEMEKVISPKSKAILAVDILGNPSDSKAIRKVADEYGLWYIADCAQSFGARRDRFPASHLADALVISLTSGKTLFAGEGGAIVTNNSNLYEKLLWHTQHPFRQKRELGLGISNEFGINGRIHPLAAIWANTQFESSLRSLKLHQNYCFRVIEYLNESSLTESIDFAKQSIVPSFFRLTVQLKRKGTEAELITYLAERGIPVTTSPVPFSLIYQQPAFQAQYVNQFCLPDPCRVAERQARRRIVINPHNKFGNKIRRFEYS